MCFLPLGDSPCVSYLLSRGPEFVLEDVHLLSGDGLDVTVLVHGLLKVCPDVLSILLSTDVDEVLTGRQQVLHQRPMIVYYPQGTLHKRNINN